MITCPQCKKAWPASQATCATCQADLSLLAHFVSGLSANLEAAESLVKEGRVNEAIAQYLAVLEIDPDNLTARARLGDWAAAVRAFDRPQTPSPPVREPPQLPPPPAVQIGPPTTPQAAPLGMSGLSWAMVLIGIGLFVSGFALGFLSHPW